MPKADKELKIIGALNLSLASTNLTSEIIFQHLKLLILPFKPLYEFLRNLFLFGDIVSRSLRSLVGSVLPY